VRLAGDTVEPVENIVAADVEDVVVDRDRFETPLARLLADEIGTHLEQFGQFLRAVVGAAEQLLGGRVIADSHRAPRFRRDLRATPTPSQNARHRHLEHRRRSWSRGRFGSRSRLRQPFALLEVPTWFSSPKKSRAAVLSPGERRIEFDVAPAGGYRRARRASVAA